MLASWAMAEQCTSWQIPAGISKLPPPPFSPSISDSWQKPLFDCLKTQTLFLWSLQPWHLTKAVDRLSEILKCSCSIVPWSCSSLANIVNVKNIILSCLIGNWQWNRGECRVQESIIDDFSRSHEIQPAEDQIIHIIILVIPIVIIIQPVEKSCPSLHSYALVKKCTTVHIVIWSKHYLKPMLSYHHKKMPCSNYTATNALR